MRDKILELLRQRPFQAFRIYLSNGREHLVRHPEQVMLGPSYIIIGVPVDDASGPEMRDTTFTSLLHIVEVSPVVATSPSSN